MRRYLTLIAALLFAAPLCAAVEDVRPDGATISTDNSCSTGTAPGTLGDDPDSPAADWCTATTCGGSGTSSPVWHLNLGTPTGPPATGTDAQVFAARVRLCGSATSTPTCRLDAYCAGVLVESGTEQNVTSTTGQTITEAWTFTGACSADGSDAEVRLVCTSSGGSPTNRRTGDADAVEWRAEVSEAQTSYHAIIVGGGP